MVSTYLQVMDVAFGIECSLQAGFMFSACQQQSKCDKICRTQCQ